MSGILEKSSPRNEATQLSVRRAHGRTANIVADLLRRELSVPEIYLEPRISGAGRPDVLAVDRAGSGDTHAVEIKMLSIFPTASQLRMMLSQIKEQPFHYKYLAMPGFLPDLTDGRKFSGYSQLFAETGIGRVGVISFDPKILRPSAAIGIDSVALTVRPERFRVSSDQIAKLERFLARTRPDIAVRI